MGRLYERFNKSKMINLRHGDWLFKQIEKLPEGLKKAENKIKSDTVFRFATGEATNHHHEVATKKAEDMEWFSDELGNYYVKFTDEALAKHPEHSVKTDLKIMPGIYKVYQAEEYDWFQDIARKVID